MLLKIEERDWKALVGGLLARQDVETAAVLLAEPIGNSRLVVRTCDVVPDHGYLIREYDRIRIDPVVINNMTREARQNGWGIFTVHSHPGASEAWFSWADDRGDDKLMRAFQMQIPDVAHGSLVVAAGGHAVARWFDAGMVPQQLMLQTVGLRLLSQPPESQVREETYDRQELALGAAGQVQVRSCRVGVVGLGGVGSAVAMQLAHLGVRSLVLVDGDVVEETNRSRIVLATPHDVGARKVDVAARYVGLVNPRVEVDTQPHFVRSASDLVELASCDVIFSAVDKHTPRALLNRLAYEALVPVIDMGSAFRVDDVGHIVSEGGRVVVLGPGRPCLACWGHINSAALREEALPDDARDAEREDGYIQGANVPEPSVIAFNTAIAGMAVVEFLRLVTGFAGAENPPNRLGFSFTEGTVRRNGLASKSDCRICGERR